MEFLAGSEKRFYEFIGNLTEKDKIALIMHKDGDGICSGVIASKVLGKVEYLHVLDYKAGMFKELADKLASLKINKIIIIDLVVQSEEDILKKIEKFSEILIIDHHTYAKDFNSEKTVFIRTPSNFPAAYACYYLFSKIQKIPEWLGVLGALSDLSYRYREESSLNIYEDFGFSGEKKDLWNYCIILGNAITYFNENPEQLYKIVMNARSADDLNGLEVYAKVVEEEFNFYLKDFDKNLEEHENLLFYHFKPKFPIGSQLSTVLSLKDPNKTFILVDESKELLKVSARCQSSKVDCVRLLQKSIKDIPDSNSGGHIPASGARVPSKFLKQFKENLFKAYDSLK